MRQTNHVIKLRCILQSELRPLEDIKCVCATFFNEKKNVAPFGFSGAYRCIALFLKAFFFVLSCFSFLYLFFVENYNPRANQANEFHVPNRIHLYPVNLFSSSIQTPQHDAQRDKDVEISY